MAIGLPTTGRVSSPFGWRWSFTNWHGGIDFAAPVGTAVYAVHPGTVVNVWPNGVMSKYGLTVVVKHDLPSDAPYSLYAHLSAASVKKGARVVKGQRIASVGTTAASSENPKGTVPAHLHFELLRVWPPPGKDKQRVDPTGFLDIDIPRAKTGFGLGAVAVLLGVWWWLRRGRT